MLERTRLGLATLLEQAAMSIPAGHSKKIRLHYSTERKTPKMLQVIVFAVIVEWWRPTACFESLYR